MRGAKGQTISASPRSVARTRAVFPPPSQSRFCLTQPISDSWSGGRSTQTRSGTCAVSEFRQLCKAVGHLPGTRPPEGAGGKQDQGNAGLDAVASAPPFRAEPALGCKIQVGEQSEPQHWSSSSQLYPLSTTWRGRGPTAIPFLHLDLGHSPASALLGGSKEKGTCMKWGLSHAGTAVCFLAVMIQLLFQV